MIKETLSFGLVMLAENTITLFLIADLMCRVLVKISFIRHPHLYWKSGLIFLAYLLCAFLCVLGEAVLSFYNYVLKHQAVETIIVSFRVTVTTLIMLGKMLLWNYSVHGGFNLFK